jgi:predicted NBD/HSP70 family sugar kinase
VFELARDGNDAVRAVVEHVGSRLGAAIATVCAIIDPELVVLGGGIGAHRDEPAGRPGGAAGRDRRRAAYGSRAAVLARRRFFQDA